MTNSDTKLYLDARSSRELEVTVTGTPEALRSLAASLSSAVDALPSSLESRQPIYLKGFEVADASGSKRETYLSFCAEPLGAAPKRRIRGAVRNWVGVVGIIFLVVVLLVGFMTIFHWIL